MDEMVLALLKQFQAKLRTRLDHLIFFRDGVSAG